MKPRVLQLFAAGVNCDRELRHAWEQAGAVVEEVHLCALVERPARLRDCELLALPGGFSYGDDLGAGTILAAELRRFLAAELHALHERGGSLFGVCNGFQALVKCGLLPGLPGLRASLTWNRSHRFECRWVRLRVERGLAHMLPEGTVFAAASAHAEGRFVLADPATDLARLAADGLIALRYADAAGRPTAEFPACPNGSDGAIAGLVSASGRIVGLMPHPERNLGPGSLPDRGAGAWGAGGEGIDFFRALLAPYAAASPA